MVNAAHMYHVDETFVHKINAKLVLLSVTVTLQKLNYCNTLLERSA